MCLLPPWVGLCVERSAAVEAELPVVRPPFLCRGLSTGVPHLFFPFFLQIINAVVLLILLSALADPDQYHFSSSELGGDFEFMDDASKYISERW